ncbi:SRPBCC family protein [Streptomyces sp. NPDC003038]|uniref:SRPBCC family protein n=1 Tax=unclassified Streptomyces TaxID=2593676 RepID=UPI0033A70D81
MAERHRLIRRPPADVWAVLCDGQRYADWVVGTHASWEDDGGWPREGSALKYQLKFGPWTYTGRTIARILEPGRRLELEAMSGKAGSARIAIEVKPWGEDTLVIVDEHPLRGPAAALHTAALDALLQLRHRNMLSRLARLVESGKDSSRDGA